MKTESNLTKKQRYEAEQNYIARPPVKNELGGGIYYTCHWLKCNETVKRWMRFCPACGQRILWEGDEE